MKKIILSLLLLVACSLPAQVDAASKSSFGMSWSSTIATGETSDFVSGFQARGVNLEYRQRVNTNWSWGINAGYNVFSETGNSTIYGDHFQATGQWGKYINTIPIYAAAYYDFGAYTRRSGRFYAAMNAGTAWLEQRTALGLYTLEEDNWHFGMAPEFGYHLPWDSFIGHVSVRYNYMFKSGAIEDQSWFEFRVGFGL
jgi:Outer membrane protein beta-barrel domain